MHEGCFGNTVRVGDVSAGAVDEDDDIAIVISPQSIAGFSVLPSLANLTRACERTGTALLLFNPRLKVTSSRVESRCERRFNIIFF